MPKTHVGKKTRRKKIAHAEFMANITDSSSKGTSNKVKRKIKKQHKAWKERARKLKDM